MQRDQIQSETSNSEEFQIQSIRRLRVDPAQQRRKYEQKLKVANQLMHKAMDSHEWDRKLMAQALDFYVQATDILPDMSEPYLKLAYLSYYFEQEMAALQWLHTCLQHNPFCQPAKQMLLAYQTEMTQQARHDALHQLASKAMEQH